MLDNCINRAVAKTFSVNERQSIQHIRLNLNLPNVEVIGPILWGHSGPLCHALSLSLL